MPRGRDSTKMPCFWHEEAVFLWSLFSLSSCWFSRRTWCRIVPQCFHMAGKKLLASMVRIWASCESASWFSSFPVDVESPAVFFDPSGEDGTGESDSGQITCSGVVQEASKAFSTISYSRSVSRILMLMKIVPGRVLFAVFTAVYISRINGGGSCFPRAGDALNSRCSANAYFQERSDSCSFLKHFLPSLCRKRQRACGICAVLSSCLEAAVVIIHAEMNQLHLYPGRPLVISGAGQFLPDQ